MPLTGFPLLFFLYEEIARGETIFAVEKSLPQVARRIAELLHVPLITFGHTHIPRLIPLSRGVSFVDTGTWGPMFQKGSRTELVPGYRNYLIASFGGEEGVTILFDSLMA